jgi:N-acetylgalactosamine-6-sulfatase
MIRVCKRLVSPVKPAALVIGLLACSLVCRADDPPNVVFLLADDLGWGDLGCYGQRQIKTPRLDALARQGTLFTQFYVNGSVCSPSRCAFLTSRFPGEMSLHGHLAQHEQNERRGMPDALDPATPTIAGILRQRGYSTGHVGKWHLGGNAESMRQLGFDFAWTIDRFGENGAGNLWTLDRRHEASAAIVDKALAFVRQHQGGPFYLNVWFNDPHATLNPSDEQLEPYANLTDPNLRFHSQLAIYAAAVTELDRQIGRLLDGLDELGLADRTVVVFSSDNGPEDEAVRNASHSGAGSAGPFRGRKRSLYEGGVRVPFLLRWPGRVPAGRIENDSVVSAVDFLPTLAALSSTSLPVGLSHDGEDQSDVWFGASRPRRTPLYWEWRFNVAGHVWHKCPMVAVREGEWKLLFNPDQSRVELYRIPEDPTEQNNLAGQHPDVVARLMQMGSDWQKTLPPGPTEPAAGRNDYPWPGTAPAARRP